MVEVQVSRTIRRPADEVFAFFGDHANNPRWQAGQRSCVWTSPPPIGVGSTYDQEAGFLGRTIRTSFEVVEFEPGTRIRIRSTSGPMPIDVTRTVEPVDAFSCRVEAVIRGEMPGFAMLLGGLARRRMQSSIEGDYDRLVEVLESGAGS